MKASKPASAGTGARSLVEIRAPVPKLQRFFLFRLNTNVNLSTN